MKKYFLIGLMSTLCSYGGYAQELIQGPEFKNAIKSNPFGWFAGQYQLAYERSLGQKTSIQLSAGYINRTSSSDLFDYSGVLNGFIFIPEFKYYIEESALDGMYFSVFSRIRTTKFDVDYNSSNYSYVEDKLVAGGGVLFGYQAVLSEGILFDVFAGPQFKSVSSTITYDDSSVQDDDFSDFATFKWSDNSGVGLRFGFNFGYAF